MDFISDFWFTLLNRFLNDNNLRIFTEYKVGHHRLDLAIVEIDPALPEEYLGDCVTKVIVAVEMKYKNAYTNESIFYQDIEKIFSYIDTWGKDTMHYFAFVQEKYFKTEEVINWIEDDHIASAQGKVTELYAYTDKTVWKVFDY